MSTTQLKASPLEAVHLRLGARLVPFAGFNMPVQYSGITEEHLAVRQGVGVFDISHMGQFLVSGPDAQPWLNRLLASNVAALAIGQGHYSFLLNEQGGVIDDLILYRLEAEEFLLVVNASKIEEDWAWMTARQPKTEVGLQNASDSIAGMAVQGPHSAELYAKLAGEFSPLPPRNHVSRFEAHGGTVIICRTGYTGEDGFELFCESPHAEAWLERILALGAKPCGLGARDTLRLEMCYPLNGNDLAPDKTPLEAGLGFFVDLTKPDFVGREVLVRQKESGPPSKLAALRMVDKGPPPRAHYAVLHAGAQISELSSGGFSPSLNCGIAMAYLPPELARIGTRLQIDIRGKLYTAEVVKKPFLKH